jgi:S1-C subfamily serine protease
LAPVLLAAGCGDSEKAAKLPEPTKLTSKQVFERARPGTVSITGTQGDSVSGGTGVVIDAKAGLVLTNYHVVAGLAGLKARVLDQEQVALQVVGTAPCDDLALTKLTSVPPGIKAIPIGDSTKVTNQDEVTALGYPSSFEDPATQKVVSSNGTVQSPEVAADTGPSSPRLPSTIQHSATTNPGNSGGPLLNDRAELVGINSLYNPGDDRPIENQFYAITTERVNQLLPDLKAGKNIADAGWDVAAFQEVPISSLFEATGYGTPAEGEELDQLIQEAGIDGVVVYGTTPGSPADKAEITGGDMVTSIAGANISTASDVCDALQSATPGRPMAVEGLFLTSGGDVAAAGDFWKVRMKLPVQ